MDRQKSRWAILKLRMLLWIVNRLGGGSPTSTNSSKFEAGHIRDNPALVKLAWVLAIFYLPPAPDAAGGGDSSGSGKSNPHRMFVLLHPFAEQGAARLKRLGL